MTALCYISDIRYSGTSNAINRVTGSKDDIDEDALNKELDEGLDDGLDHVEQLLVRLVVSPPITLHKIRLCELNAIAGENACTGQKYTQLIGYTFRYSTARWIL